MFSNTIMLWKHGMVIEDSFLREKQISNKFEGQNLGISVKVKVQENMQIFNKIWHNGTM